MKLWHDDLREPPDSSWRWARTNQEAKDLLTRSEGRCSHLSLDHDLGLHDLDPAMFESPEVLEGQSSETGMDLVDWLLENQHLLPTDTLRIHSWNQPAAAEMAARLRDEGIDPIVRPFDMEEDRP